MYEKKDAMKTHRKNVETFIATFGEKALTPEWAHCRHCFYEDNGYCRLERTYIKCSVCGCFIPKKEQLGLSQEIAGIKMYKCES